MAMALRSPMARRTITHRATAAERTERTAEGAVKGVGRLDWGPQRETYYGADGVGGRFAKRSEREQFQELRDEEAIGLQMQSDELRYQRKNDFVDREMEMLAAEITPKNKVRKARKAA